MSSVFKLIIEDDAGRQIVVPFSRETITIGRKEGNTIRLTERNVSRNHARLLRENGHVLIEDLGSFNGIKLNGDRIDGRVSIHEGDTIQIGDYHLALHEQPDAASGEVSHAPGQRTESSEDLLGASSSEQDQFAGDTQRWIPPITAELQTAQGLTTAEERPSPGVPPEVQARPSSSDDDTHSDGELGAQPQSASDDPRSAGHAVDVEPTVRQVTAPPPSSAPTEPSFPSFGSLLSSSPTPALGRPASLHAAELIAASGAVTGSVTPALAETPPTRVPPTVVPPPESRPAVPSAESAATHSAASSTDPLSAPRFVALNTTLAGKVFPLRGTEMILGRTTENDVIVEHRSISRNHAKVVREGDRVRILDLKSANGVLVNSEEVDAAVLRSGDVVELGRVRLRFVPAGERFELSAQDIERARVLDVGGDEFEADSRTGVTNPIRQKISAARLLDERVAAPAPAPSKAPTVVAVIAVLVALVLAVLLFIGPNVRGSTPPATPASPPVRVSGGAAPPSNAAPAAPNPSEVGSAPVAADAPSPEAPADLAAPPTPQAAPNEPTPDQASASAAQKGALESGAVPAPAAPPEAQAQEQQAASAPEQPTAPPKVKPVEKRPSKAMLDVSRSNGLKAFFRGDWREAVEVLGAYRKWVKDDKTVNETLRRAQEKLKQ